MTRTTPNPVATPKDLVRAVLAHARRGALREVRFTPDGVVGVGFFGDAAPLAREGRPVAVPFAAVRAHLTSRSIVADGWRRDGDGCEFDGLGTWNKVADEDGRVVLRARKPGAPCLEALAEGPADDLARLRSLYRESGVDVFVLVEGASRARDIALALTAERKASGLPTSLDLGPDHDDYGRAYPDDHRGPEPFDGPGAASAPAWSVTHLEGKRDAGLYGDNPRNLLVKAMGRNEDAPGGRILVAENGRRSYRSEISDLLGLAEKRARPSVVVEVRIEKSKPVVAVGLNAKAAALASESHGFADAPWDRLAARKEARLKSRPPVPNTWHQTTEAVAEAYVARQAPRGLISGNSLFFHGPVAYSVWRDAPVAAFVASPTGEAVLFMGRERDIGGGKAAITSMAQEDIRKAAGERFPIVRMEELSTFLKVGDIGVGDFRNRVGGAKAEGSHPALASIDPEGMARWFRARLAERLKVRDEAYATKVTYPTKSQAEAHDALARLADFRDEMAARFKLDPPNVGSAAAYRAAGDEAWAKVAEREAALKARRERQAESEAEAEGPGGPRP